MGNFNPYKKSYNINEIKAMKKLYHHQLTKFALFLALFLQILLLSLSKSPFLSLTICRTWARGVSGAVRVKESLILSILYILVLQLFTCHLGPLPSTSAIFWALFMYIFLYFGFFLYFFFFSYFFYRVKNR